MDALALSPQPAAFVDLVPFDHVASSEHPALVYLASLAPGSRRTMRQALDVVAAILTADLCDHRTMPWAQLRFQHTQAVRSVLMERYSPKTANKMLSALKQTIKTAWNLGYLTAEEYQRATALKPVMGERPEAAAGRALSFGEWAALFAVCRNDPSISGARDAAILAILRVGGLRRAELAQLQLADYNSTTQTLTIKGKRSRVRILPIEDSGALDALGDWLVIRGNTPGPLFVRIGKGGRLTTQPLTDQGIYYILLRRGQQAGVPSFTPHDLRRTFAGDLLDAGADLATVQKLMGHSDANTTVGYDRRGEHAKHSAVRKLH
ncbi:MAG: tyrosine-type recombinase/integrase, partial [Caldilinea sp.]